MVMDMINYLVGHFHPDMTEDAAAMVLIEARFPVRIVGENIHSVFEHAKTLNAWLTTKIPGRI